MVNQWSIANSRARYLRNSVTKFDHDHWSFVLKAALGVILWIILPVYFTMADLLMLEWL